MRTLKLFGSITIFTFVCCFSPVANAQGKTCPRSDYTIGFDGCLHRSLSAVLQGCKEQREVCPGRQQSDEAQNVASDLHDLAEKIEAVLRRTFQFTTPSELKHVATRKAPSEIVFASVLVGLGPKPIGYKFVLLASIPAAMEHTEEMKIRQSVAPVMKKITSNLQKTIDELPVFSQKPDQDLEKQLSSYTEGIQKSMQGAFRAASEDFKTQFGSLSPNYVNDSSLALALRPCVDEACSFAQFASAPAKNRFGRLYDWTNSKGLKTVNQAYAINSDGSFTAVVAALDQGRQWHDDFPKPVLQDAFLNAAKQSRNTNTTVSYSAAELVGLSKENVAHLADVFDLPYAAASRLGTNGVNLEGLSDELGRARLRECVRIRGAFEPEKAGQCAGFKINEKDLANCLAGRDCLPAFGDQVNVATLLVRPNSSLSVVAGSTILPRISLGTAGGIVELANKCQANSSEEAADCLLTETMRKAPNAAETMDCTQAAGSNAWDLAKCAKKGLPDEEQRRIECFQDDSKDTKDIALCATRDALPPNAQKMIVCADKLKDAQGVDDAMKCTGFTTGSPEGDCVLNHKDSWADAALCIGGGDNAPKPVRDAVDCSQQTSDLTSFGVCMVAAEGSGEAQRIAACYAEAQGVPAAVAVCLASKYLTQDQRIVLECAAETNGAPHATAICAGGKMAAKEMMNCKGKKFGEGDCFNENNEIRKFFANAGVEIGPNSVAAQVINLQLQIAQLTVGPILEAANKELPELINFAQRIGIVPDLSNPGKMIATGLAGPIFGSAMNDFCSHNPCNPLDWKL
jgi:hypothetical protein